VRTDSLTQQKPVAIPYEDANTDMRPFIFPTVHDLTARLDVLIELQL
jgi:hypothetical protein